MTLDLQEVAIAIQAGGKAVSAPVTGYSVDTRTQSAGDLYFALHGPNHDGHDFVAAAMEKGAAAVVVETRFSNVVQKWAWGAAGNGKGTNVSTAAYLLVEDTMKALQQLGAWARTRWGGQVVGVTGSAGKTTTKDAIAHLLASELPVGKTVGNFNNHVGVPLSILRLPDDCHVGVLEMGMNHAGEIRELAAIARPDVGVVTNVGYAHVEFFDSIEGVAAAKRELIEGLQPGGVAVLNADDARVLKFREVFPGRTVTFGFAAGADIRAEQVDLGATGTRFRVSGVEYETGLTGRHAVSNLLAAIAVAQVFGIPAKRLREPVRSFAIGKMRGERLEHHGIIVWNDCYNSNPEAVQAMIDVLWKTPAKKRIAVLGEMLELGHASDRLHRQVGRYAREHGVDRLIGVRGSARAMVDEAVAAGLPESDARFFEDPADAGELAREWAISGDAVLFKGSRGVRVEKALEKFLQEQGRASV